MVAFRHPVIFRNALSALAVVLVWFSLALPAAGDPGDIFIPLNDEGFDMELDEARQQIYVSIPNDNEVVVLSAVTGQVVNRLDLASHPAVAALGASDPILVGPRPHGLDISLDGSLLFVALNQASSVVYVDLETFDLTQVVIGQQLGDSRTYDVIEAKPDWIFASANASSSGFSYITLIQRDMGNIASRVANQRIIRARPTFAASPDQEFLYVSEGFSPNSLYKLDISTDEAPIILEDDHGSVSGTEHLEVSPDGERIYLGSGQVLQTADFVQIGIVARGIPRLNADGTRVYVAQEPGSIQVYETHFFTKVDEIDLPCAYNNIRTFELLDDGNGFVLLGDDNVCGIGNVGFQRPTCEVRPRMETGDLILDFEVATPEPVVWNLWLSAGSTNARLWSVSIPAVATPVSFEVPVPGFPAVGTAGFLSTFTTSSQGITCSDWQVVDTGSPAAPLESSSLRGLFGDIQR